MKTSSRLFYVLVTSALLFAPTVTWANTASEFDSWLGQCRAACDTAKNPFQFYGWMKGGITLNNHGNTTSYGPNALGVYAPASRNQEPDSGNSYLLMNEQQTDLKLSHLWLGMSKAIDTKHGFDWGFQGDYIYGTDAKYTQHFGDRSFDYNWGKGDYYSSIVQLYAEVGYCNLKFKVGKFAPGMTHEALPAVATFFNSAAYTCYNTPLTVNGAIAEYKVNDCLSFSGGWTAGYHSSFDNRFGDNAFLGNVTLKTSRATALRYGVFCNDAHGDPAYDRFYDSGTEWVHMLVFTYQINRCWFYMIEGLYVDNDYKAAPDYTTNAYGINQHLIRTISSKLSLGLRGEWHRAEGTIFDIPPITRGGQGGDIYALSFGANWNVSPKITIRPELRYDWANYDNGWQPFGGGTKSEQLTGGGSVVMKF